MSVKTESLPVLPPEYIPPPDPWQPRLVTVKGSDVTKATNGDQGFLPVSKYRTAFNRKFWDSVDIGMMPKDIAEKTETWKQLVAYVVVEDEAGRILQYRRCKKQGDERLMGQLSIGVGGHVEHKDASEDGVRSCRLGAPSAAMNAAVRELGEEVEVEFDDIGVLGYIIDDSNEVGRMHLGVVFKVFLGPTDKPVYRDGITEPEWKRPADIDMAGLEPWSQMVVMGLLDDPEL